MKTKLTAQLMPAVCAAASLCTGAHAQTQTANELSPIQITATRIGLDDTAAPFAAEVYTQFDIKKSGAVTLYDFLEKFTSLQVTPSVGNQAAPNIDARGFGQQFGYENLVVAVDGRRLNNIDMSNPFLASVPLQSIERIEITLGSGAVLYGDGAMAGVINIVTRPSDSANFTVHAGANGQNGVSVNVGKIDKNFHIAFAADQTKIGAFGDKDALGNKDSSQQENWNLSVGWKSESDASFDIYAGQSNQDIWYPGYLSQSQWFVNPAQTPSTGASGYGYSHQTLKSESLGARLTAPLSAATTLKATFHTEDKTSTFIKPYTYGFDYSVREAEISLAHNGADVKSVIGLQNRMADRTSAGSNVTGKDSLSVFFQRTHFWEDYTWMYGARSDRVNLDYTALDGSNTLHQVARLGSFESGLNKRINDRLGVFGNYSHSVRTPDVDMFFSYDWANNRQVFNGSISPMTADTLTLGFNHLDDGRKLKSNIFYSKISNEIFYYPAVYVNTNYEKTHKYGFELQDREQISPVLDGWFNYSYTVAAIDKDSTSIQTGTLSGTSLPGVSKNVLSGGVRWSFAPDMSLSLTQTWRDRAYALNDVTNTAPQMQRIYRSTDLMLSRTFSNKIQGYVSVKNLFNQANGAWVDVNQIYPYNFTRNWVVGLKASL